MSLRELAHQHGMTAHSGVVVQARKGGWSVAQAALAPCRATITRLT